MLVDFLTLGEDGKPVLLYLSKGNAISERVLFWNMPIFY